MKPHPRAVMLVCKRIDWEAVTVGVAMPGPPSKKVVDVQLSKSLNTTLNLMPSAKAFMAIILRLSTRCSGRTNSFPRSHRKRVKRKE